MTEYMKPSFTVALGSKLYRDNWSAVFGPKCEYCGKTAVHIQEPCPYQGENRDLCDGCFYDKRSL